MKALGLVVLVLLQAQGQQPTLPRDPVKDFKVRRTELRRDPQTNRDIEEITFIIRADEAIPVRVEKNKETFELRGVTARYFTEPDKDKLSKEIEVTARRGFLDNEARTLKL